jgi:hypothetical protein
MSQILPPRPVSALERAVDATFRKGLDKVSYNENTLELTRVKAHVLFSILSPAKFKYTHVLTSDEQVRVSTIPPFCDDFDHHNNDDCDSEKISISTIQLFISQCWSLGPHPT